MNSSAWSNFPWLHFAINQRICTTPLRHNMLHLLQMTPITNYSKCFSFCVTKESFWLSSYIQIHFHDTYCASQKTCQFLTNYCNSSGNFTVYEQNLTLLYSVNWSFKHAPLNLWNAKHKRTSGSLKPLTLKQHYGDSSTFNTFVIRSSPSFILSAVKFHDKIKRTSGFTLLLLLKSAMNSTNGTLKKQQYF